MPTYSYECSKCENLFELYSSISEYKDCVKCPQCKGKANRSIVTDAITLNGSVRLGDDELKTLGHLAMRNTERFSDDQKMAIDKKNNAYKEEKEKAKKALPQGMSRIQRPKTKFKWR